MRRYCPHGCNDNGWIEVDGELYPCELHPPTEPVRISLTPFEDERAEAAELRKMTYADYLSTRHWRETRIRALRRAGFRCERCDRKALQVHHLTYERLGRESPLDLEVLCKPCHALHHGRFTQETSDDGEIIFELDDGTRWRLVVPA